MINPNFHIIGKESIFDSKHKEYRQQWHENPQKNIISNFPLHLDVEASAICNLKCDFCRTQVDDISEPKFMNWSTYTKVIDEGAKEGLYAIKLNSGSRGEPLLHKLLPDMIEYAKDKGILDVYFNTNATLLTKKLSKKLMESGLDRISISFDGHNKETYEKYRKHSFEDTLKNIMNFIDIRNENFDTKIRIQTVKFDDVNLDEYYKFWSPFVDEVAYIDKKDYSAPKKKIISNWKCPYLWQRMMVRWDGNIAMCGFDYEGNFGNVNHGYKIKTAWQNWNAMERIRTYHKMGGSHMIVTCNRCTFRATEIKKLE